ncbi:uncharacterized protein LOC125772142 isoform X1 [Anopheles funestus]|uniref:uncharacterized protein LOC125772142 isoform X1 n=1 Tax=Anopheles funestus TaxID=62324 RepID=UPI0020C6A634|nr:uncharacterized protein LOC125772142 isoform X1 [Anopheles funestus]XP_049299524.1 uncharacterized protein LOC125772142 isoform X1 [Anopheles funestus]XP_049299525.1 uncharacterized protein LOC125772142 isoform X1 [Anopheles funestus]
MLALAALLAVHAGLAGSIPTAPENITVTFLTPTSVRVSWQTSMDPHTMPVDKYDVTYKPTDASYRVVVVVAGNRDAVTLGGLTPDTQYQLTVAAVWNGKKYRSRPIVFRTLEPPRTSYQQDSGSLVGSSGPPNSPHADTAPSLSGIGIFNDEFGNISVNSTSRELPTIRGVEIGIVVLVLIVWAGAIALFFNRWGKIRMLLPYQPDYKQEQLKVPGTGVCANGTCNGQHSHQPYHPWPEEPSSVISERCTRARINSAIFVSSEGKGFDSIEFIRRYGSQSVLCRKAKSAENVSASERQRRFSEYPEWETEDSTTGNGTSAHSASNTRRKKSLRQDSIELVECHKEPAAVTVPVPVPLPTVTPGAVPVVAGTTATLVTVGVPIAIGSKTVASATAVTAASVATAGIVKPTPKLSNLPTLSVSGPSPPHEEEFLRHREKDSPVTDGASIGSEQTVEKERY